MSEVLKGDWYSDKSRVGLGAGWRCRKCGTWVDIDSPMVCVCTSMGNGSESPTVVFLKNENANLQHKLNEAKDIITILADQHLIQHDGKYRGAYATRINALLGL